MPRRRLGWRWGPHHTDDDINAHHVHPTHDTNTHTKCSRAMQHNAMQCTPGRVPFILTRRLRQEATRLRDDNKQLRENGRDEQAAAVAAAEAEAAAATSAAEAVAAEAKAGAVRAALGTWRITIAASAAVRKAWTDGGKSGVDKVKDIQPSCDTHTHTHTRTHTHTHTHTHTWQATPPMIGKATL